MAPTLLLAHLPKDEQKQQHRQYELFYSYHLLSQGPRAPAGVGAPTVL